MGARIDIDRSELEAFCRRNRIRRLAMFGSVLREDFDADSDVDVLIVLDESAPWDFFDWVDMIDELERIFGRSVDLVEKTAITNPFRRRHILQSHQVIYAGGKSTTVPNPMIS